MNLAICSTCFGLRDMDESTTQRCGCQPQFPMVYGPLDCPSGFHLCYLCARGESGGWSRWSWNACQPCLNLNQLLKKKMGFSLPLGRHSFMNGVGISVALGGAQEAKGIEALAQFVNHSTSLHDWSALRARELFESIPEWSDKKVIPIGEWRRKFSPNKQNSLRAFELYYGINFFSESKS